MREKGGMPEPQAKVKVYGLSLTRRQYILIQIAAFVWMLLLYGYWRYAGLQASPNKFARNLDLLLLAVYVYGVVETLVVFRKFKKAKFAPEEKKMPDQKST